MSSAALTILKGGVTSGASTLAPAAAQSTKTAGSAANARGQQDAGFIW